MQTKRKKLNKFLRLIFSGVTLLLFLQSVSVSAKTLEEYKNNIAEVKKAFDGVSEESENYEEKVDETFEKALKLLPPKDKIEIDGKTLEINNQWLSDKINKYRKSASDETEKKRLLVEISESLKAIQARIDELESAAAGSTSKNENKQKLNEILKREEYAKPEKQEESLFARAWRQFIQWLRGVMPTPPKVPKGQVPTYFQSIAYYVQIFIYVLLGLLAAFLIYKFTPFLLKKIRSRKKRSKRERIILGEKIAADETSENLFSEAEKLATKGDLRSAIRKGYIALLFELGERKIVGLAKHKTNRDYLRDVRKREKLRKNMDGLTLNYERHWYGFDVADEKDWEEFKDDYEKAIKQT